eukprot:751542-Hanusia_phi.AAC.3
MSIDMGDISESHRQISRRGIAGTARARIADVYFFEELSHCCGKLKAKRWLISQGRTGQKLNLEEANPTQTQERTPSVAIGHALESDSFKSKRATPKAIEGFSLQVLSFHNYPYEAMKKSKSQENLKSTFHCDCLELKHSRSFEDMNGCHAPHVEEEISKLQYLDPDKACLLYTSEASVVLDDVDHACNIQKRS